ncbi:MAG: 3'-5' exonuclease [Candidatus Omnitrophica bacterium]|nr:3'-5' exonuclease [Candidatus Omnitrophota bacterium]
MKISRPLVVLDLETTGTWVEKDKIVEIGMVKHLPDGSKESYVKRVNPGMHIPESVSKITGISDEDVKDALIFSKIAPEVIAFLGDCNIGGFNIERFDIPLLEREIIDVGLKFELGDRVVYDAQKIYNIHEKRNLTAAYKFYCNKALDNAHSALGDVEATFEILSEQVNKYGSTEEGISSLAKFDYERSLDYFDKGRKFRWWNSELYPMFGKHARRHSIRELVKRDRAYLEWILSKDFSVEVKAMIGDALSGAFPKPPKR